MGMSINEALGYMPCLMEACSHCLVKGCDKPIEKIDEAKLMVIETMRKYKELLDYIGGMNMCDEISNEAYKKIMIKFSE